MVIVSHIQTLNVFHYFVFLQLVFVIVTTENIPKIILWNTDELTVLRIDPTVGRIKMRVRSGYANLIVVGRVKNSFK